MQSQLARGSSWIQLNCYYIMIAVGLFEFISQPPLLMESRKVRQQMTKVKLGIGNMTNFKLAPNNQLSDASQIDAAVVVL